jgi:tetratricopeptide (TPR) repeat protein
VQAALQILEGVSTELADASLSFDLGSPPDYMTGRASFSTDAMLARIDESPKRAIRTDYVDAWRDYGRKVSAEYSFNFIPSRNVFSVLYGRDRTPFVHYSIEIEPQDFSMEAEQDRSKFYTTLDISVEVTDSEDNLVVSRDKEIFLQMNPGQLEQVGSSPFSYQDDFPLIPGEYNVSVILRNRVSRQYTVAEREVKVPRVSEGGPVLSDIILGFRTETKSGELGSKELRAFQIGNLQIQPSAENLFVLGETVHAFMQAEGLAPDYGFHFSLLDGEEVLQEKRTLMEDYQGGPVLERFHLTQMIGGSYELKVQVTDPTNNVVAERSAPVQLSPRSDIARPWIYRVSFNPNTPGVLALARGDQLWRMNRFGAAQQEFQNAFDESKGELPLARWKLAEAYIRASNPDAALELLTPIEARFPRQYEVVAGLGFAHYLKDDYDKAAEYLSRAVELRPAGVTLLNALGHSYLKLGDIGQAKPLLERSLAMDPNQVVPKELLASIEGNRKQQ